MKFWTKRTKRVMVLFYIMGGLSFWQTGGTLFGYILGCVIWTLLAYGAKWLYVTAKTPPGGEESEPEAEAAD
jgi:hypothetical protein